MAVFPIRRFGDPVLRRKADDVAFAGVGRGREISDGLFKLIADMRETMNAAPGVGLAAPQIGVSKRVIVWRYEEDEGALVNPSVVDQRGAVEAEEACLSLPGLAYPVLRSEWVRVEGINELGEEVSREAEGWVARILQHEVDHTNGVLFIDRLPEELQKDARKVLREQAMEGVEPSPPESVL